MTSWGAWTTCPCGTTGQRTRERSVGQQPVGKGRLCANTTEVGTCPMVACNCTAMNKPKYYGNLCENRDCELGPWSAWSTSNCGLKAYPKYAYILYECLYTCPGNAGSCEPMKSRTREEAIEKDGNGQDCHGGKSQEISCGHRCLRQCKLSAYGACQTWWYVKG